MSDQGRDPPAFQVYAANVLARREHRLQNIAARGLTHTMNLELWVNHSLPAEPSELALFLGIPVADVTANLSACMPFFEVENGEIVSPELEAYRAHLLRIKLKQSEGGKDGAAKANANRGKPTRRKSHAVQAVGDGSATPTGDHEGDPEGNHAGNPRVLSVVQHSPVQIKDFAVAPVIKVEEENTTGDALKAAP